MQAEVNAPLWCMERLSKGHFTYFEIWILKYFERSNNLLMAGGLFLCLNQVMLSSSLSRHQGLVLDHCKNEYRHRHQNKKYTSTSIIALEMSTRRRIFLVLMALSISCYWQIITSSWTLRRRGAKMAYCLLEVIIYLIISGIKELYHPFSPFSAPHHILHILSLLFLFFPFDGN